MQPAITVAFNIGMVRVSSEFTNGTFGLRIIGQPSGGNTVRVDAMQVRVYNQSSGGGSEL